MTTTVSVASSALFVTLNITLTETVQNLSYLAGVIEWGDGTSESINRTAKTDNVVTTTRSHTYASPGTFAIKVTGQNFRSPLPDQSIVIEKVVLGTFLPSVNPGFLRGMSMPEGTPISRWSFDTATDHELIAADIMSLLITRQGERLMNPRIGTNLGSLVFEQNTSVLETLVQQEVATALAENESRATLVSTTATIENSSLNVFCIVRVNDQAITLGVKF